MTPTNGRTASASGLPSFASLLDHLNGLGLFHMDLSLDRIRGVLARLSPATPPCAVQVVGTNGKGSTAAFLDAIGRAHGLTTGLYTSPHFLDVRERILVSGRMLSEDAWLNAARRAMDAGAAELTYFELLTVLAVLLFSDQGVDMAIFEAGLGGTHDATTALPAHVLAITPVAMDHVAVLGPTLADIARDKAGAMRAGQPVFTAAQAEDAMRELERAASDRGVTLTQAAPLEAGLAPGLAGNHQRGNASLAVAVWKEVSHRLGVASDPQAVARGLAHAFIPGRLQAVDARPGMHPRLILDAAHNPHGLDSLARHLSTLDHPPCCTLFACMRDKDVAPMVERVLGLGPGPVILPAHSWDGRECPASELAAMVGPRAILATDMCHGLSLALDLALGSGSPSGGGGPYAVVTGSLYFLAEFFTLRPDCLAPPHAMD